MSQIETTTMWGAFYKVPYSSRHRLLGVFKSKKNAVKAARRQSAGTPDGFFPANHFDGIVKEVECVVVGDMAFPIEHGVGVEPNIELPKHDCRHCEADRKQAAKRKAKRDAKKKAKKKTQPQQRTA